MYLNQAIDFIVDMYFLQQETKTRFAIELVSGPGLGKSEGIQQAAQKIAKRLGKPMAVKPFFLTTVEPPDVRGFGLPGKDEAGNLTMQFTRAPWMPKAGEPDHGFIFLDEFGQAQQDVAKPAAELLLNGRVGESQLPIEYMVVAASNRETDRSGVSRSLAFIENRKMQIKIQPHLDSWVEWAETRAINPWAIAYARANPGDVFKDAIPDKPGPFCTPRTLVKVSHMMGKLSMDVFSEAASGYVGEGVAAKLVAFLRVAEQLPKYEEIIAAPEKCRLPDKDRPDAQYATMQMIAHRVDAQTAKPAFKYLQRLPKEFQVAGLKATLRRTPQLVQTPDFAAWIKDNKELVMSANILDRK